VGKWQHYSEQLTPLSLLLDEGGVAIDEVPDFDQFSRS